MQSETHNILFELNPFRTWLPEHNSITIVWDPLPAADTLISKCAHFFHVPRTECVLRVCVCIITQCRCAQIVAEVRVLWLISSSSCFRFACNVLRIPFRASSVIKSAASLQMTIFLASHSHTNHKSHAQESKNLPSQEKTKRKFLPKKKSLKISKKAYFSNRKPRIGYHLFVWAQL